MNFVTFNGAISVISDLHNLDKSLNELLMVITHIRQSFFNSIKPEYLILFQLNNQR